MSRETVRVLLRTRPTVHAAPSLQVSEDGSQTITVHSIRRHVDSGLASGETSDSLRFKFDALLHNADQESVFQQAAVSVLDSSLDGYNGTVLAYGQTGAGKTFTMSGGKDSYKSRGVTPRSIAYIFKRIREKEEQAGDQYTVRVSYLEVYNEVFYDLLDPAQDPSSIAIAEDRSGSISMRGLSAPTCLTEQDAMKWLFEGETNRAIGEHELNKSSSRSHAIFTIYLEARRGGDDSKRVVSKVHLVDLAGSERLSKTRSEGVVQKEAQFINKSLSFLEQVVLALGEKSRDHVPYRSSRLTYLLKDSLGGNSKTVVIANIWAEEQQLDETLGTCRFAQRMMRVSNQVVQNVRQESSAYIRRLEREVEELKQELALHDSFANRAQVSYQPYSHAQRAQIKETVRDFLNASIEGDAIAPLEILSARHVRELLLAARNLYREAEGRAAAAAATGPRRGEAEEGGAKRPPPAAPTSASDAAAVSAGGSDPMEAPADARPGGSVADAHFPESSGAGDAASSGPGIASGRPLASTARRAWVGRDAAFEEFKAGPGREKFTLLEENKEVLKGAKKRLREVGLAVNGAKREIDEMKAAAEDPAAAPPSEALVTRFRDLKARYKELFNEHQSVKGEVAYTEQLVETCKAELVLDFDLWFKAEFGATDADADAFDDDEPASSPSAAHVLETATARSSKAAAASASAGVTSRAVAPKRPQKGARTVNAEAAGGSASSTVAVSIPEDEAADPEARAFWEARLALHAKVAKGELGKFARKQPTGGFGGTTRAAAERAMGIEDLPGGR